MITVIEAIKLSAGFLENREIESPRLNAEIMLSHILKCRRLNLYLSYDQPLREEELDALRQMLKRRGKSEPLQYILGETEFYGLPFKVNSSVLIPRQETEILVEEVITFCRSSNARKILDIGTGSGNIAVSVAKNVPGAEITAADVSLEALETAKNNAEDNGVASRVRCRLINIFTESDKLADDYDVVVSNPPYVSRKEFDNLQPELRIYEPMDALTDYSDGFSFFKNIISCAHRWLRPGGAIFLEAGEGQAQLVREEMEKHSFKNIRIIKDYLRIDRVISGELN